MGTLLLLFLFLILAGILLYAAYHFGYISKTLPGMTRDQLKLYNGVDKTEIYLGCNGKVFDVSKSNNYKPTGLYHMFAGKDCTIALGKMSFNIDDIDDHDYSKLTVEQYQHMEEWFNTFQKKYKYKIVANIIEDDTIKSNKKL